MPWQPIKVEKSTFFPDQSTLSRCHSKRIAILQFRFRMVHRNEFLYIVYNFGDNRSRNPRVHDVNNSSDTAKIGVSCQISQNIQTYLDLLYSFVRRISRDDFPSIRLAVAQGTLLWQPVKYGRRSQTSCGTNFTLCFGIRKRIGRSQICFKGFYGNNQGTSCPNFMNFRPVI